MDSEEPDNDYYASDSENDFLADLGSDRYVSPPVIDKEQIKTQKQQEKEMKQIILQQERDRKREEREQKQRDVLQAKEMKKMEKQNLQIADKGDDDIFSNSATPILGKERILLLKKVSQYKSLFPTELKTFKIKKSPTVQELKDALNEMEVLVETGGMDEFMMGSVLSCMRLVEGASPATGYDIRGCADMLKNNKEFNKLAKVLFIKYGVFSKIPPEIQMVLLVSTTAYMCCNKNQAKGAMNEYLNTPI